MAENEVARPAVLTEELKQLYLRVSTATVTSQLQRRGIRNTFFNGLRPLRPGQRMVGYAHTLRYLPNREDLASVYGGLHSAQRRAIESVQPDEVLVIDARNEPDAGTIGDIFTMRVKSLGGAGVITDGALRDTPAISRIDLPVYHRSSHAATLQKVHLAVDHQVPIACAGVAVIPGDLIIGDEEGAMVVPASLAEEVGRDSLQMEIEEEWALERVTQGESSIGTFPIAKDRREEFDAWLARRPH